MLAPSRETPGESREEEEGREGKGDVGGVAVSPLRFKLPKRGGEVKPRSSRERLARSPAACPHPGHRLGRCVPACCSPPCSRGEARRGGGRG